MHTTREPLHPALLSDEHKTDLRNRLASTLHGYPGTYVAEAGGDPEFALWLALLDVRMRRRLGLSHRDVSDRLWRDAFDDEIDPFTCADDTINAEVFGGHT